VPTVPVERRMHLAAVAAARQKAEPRPSWCAIFTKALGFVGAARPELRRAYMSFPWAHLYEHPETVASIAFERQLGDADVVLFDGTLFTDDEMIAAGAGVKTGRRMGHMPVGGPDGTLAALAGLARRRILIHINNTNPILIEDSRERHAVEAAGFEVAEDGMRIEL